VTPSYFLEERKVVYAVPPTTLLEGKKYKFSVPTSNNLYEGKSVL
jgi:hypothetical protein